jgi:hypothetical protein
MYISKKNAIHVPFSLTTQSKTAETEEALLDSGITHNFIDKRMARRLKLGSKVLENPQTIRNADGTVNLSGSLTRFTDLEVYFEGATEVQRFYITNLGEDRAIFGFPWLRTFQPEVDWWNAQINGKAELYTTDQEPPGWLWMPRKPN